MSDSLFNINRGASLNPQNSVPTNPSNGDIYYDSTIGSFIHYNNGKWINLASKVDVASAASLTSTQFPATTVQSSLIRVTGSTAADLHGLTASSDGKEIILYNVSSAAVTVKNQSGTESTAVNRIITYASSDVTISSGQTMALVYDGTQARWIASSPAGASGGVTDHGALTGLADDDHTQYSAGAGRSGGQSLIGGTASGNNLTLRSTSNATRGKVIFGNAATTAYDEVNERFGIATASPGTPLDVVGKIRTSTQVESTVATGTAPLVVASTTNVPNLNASFLSGANLVSTLTSAVDTNNQGTGNSSNLAIASGTFTVFATNIENMIDATPEPCQWLRVGNVVTVSGHTRVNPTAGTSGTPVFTRFDLIIPVNSSVNDGNFRLYLSGSASAQGTSKFLPVAVFGNGATKVRFAFYAEQNNFNYELRYTYTYVVR